MENNLLNRQKFISQYFGQKVYRFIMVDEKSPNADNTFVDNYALTSTILSESGYVSLMPLTSITDEHTIKLIQSMGWKEMKDPIEAKAMIFTLFIIPSNDMMKYEMLVKSLLFDFSDISSAIDKIRSMGYAYKWMNVDVEKQIEYGWVKLK